MKLGEVVVGHDRHVGSPNCQPNCSDKPWVRSVLTKNFRTSNIFLTFFFMIICIFIDAKYSSKWKYIKYGKNQYIFLWLQPQIAWLRPQIDIDFSIFWPVCHLKFFVLYNLPLSIVIKFGRTVHRQFGKEVPNMFEVRRFGIHKF